MAHTRSRSGSGSSGHGRLVLAQLILFFIGLLTVFLSAFGMRDAHEEVLDIVESAPAQVADPSVQAANNEAREDAKNEMIGRIRIAYAVSLGVGLIFVVCALLVHRFPVISTVTGLTLYLGTLAMMATVDSRLVMQGIFLRVLIIIALVAAVTAALKTESRRNARLRRRAEAEED